MVARSKVLMRVLLLKSTEATRPPACRCQNRANGPKQTISGDVRCEAAPVWSGYYAFPSFCAASFRNASECSCRSFLSSRSVSSFGLGRPKGRCTQLADTLLQQ